MQSWLLSFLFYIYFESRLINLKQVTNLLQLLVPLVQWECWPLCHTALNDSWKFQVVWSRLCAKCLQCVSQFLSFYLLSVWELDNVLMLQTQLFFCALRTCSLLGRKGTIHAFPMHVCRWGAVRREEDAPSEVNIQFPSLSFVFPMFFDAPLAQPHATANLSSLWDLIFQKTQHEHLFKCLIIGRNAAVFIIVNADLYDVPIQTYLRVHLRI